MDGEPFFVVLNGASTDYTLTNLRFAPSIGSVHISNNPSYVNGQWSTLEGNGISFYILLICYTVISVHS